MTAVCDVTLGSHVGYAEESDDKDYCSSPGAEGRAIRYEVSIRVGTY